MKTNPDDAFTSLDSSVRMYRHEIAQILNLADDSRKLTDEVCYAVVNYLMDELDEFYLVGGDGLVYELEQEFPELFG